jgi:hypothetical protein
VVVRGRAQQCRACSRTCGPCLFIRHGQGSSPCPKVHHGRQPHAHCLALPPASCSARGPGDCGERGHGGAKQDHCAVALVEARRMRPDAWLQSFPHALPCSVTWRLRPQGLSLSWLGEAQQECVTNKLRGGREDQMKSVGHTGELCTQGKSSPKGFLAAYVWAGSQQQSGTARWPTMPCCGYNPSLPALHAIRHQLRSTSRSACLRLMRWSSNTRSCGARIRLYLQGHQAAEHAGSRPAVRHLPVVAAMHSSGGNQQAKRARAWLPPGGPWRRLQALTAGSRAAA